MSHYKRVQARAAKIIDAVRRSVPELDLTPAQTDDETLAALTMAFMVLCEDFRQELAARFGGSAEGLTKYLKVGRRSSSEGDGD